MCELMGYEIEIHTAASPLLDVANLHAGCATRLSRFLESHHPMFRFGLKGDPLGVREDGCQHVPTGPGLGVEIDWDWIENHTVEVIEGDGEGAIMTTNFHGILPALVTPFDGERRLHVASLDRLLDRLYSAGVHGVYVCGTTGEGLLQTAAERKAVADVVLHNSPKDKQVIVHVGAACLTEAIDLAAHAAGNGATAISSLPPAGAYSFPEVKEYYRALSRGCDAPLLIYFFPAGSAAIATTEQILELCELPNVIGLKFTDHNLYKLSEVKQSGAVVYNGYDEVLAAGLLMGADGGIGTFYNLTPELFVQVYQAARNGEWEEARRVQRRINELIAITIKFPLFAAVKQMLTWSGIECGPVLAPRRDLTEAEAAQLRAALKQSSLAGSHYAGLKVEV